jgi:hypothetical protein
MEYVVSMGNDIYLCGELRIYVGAWVEVEEVECRCSCGIERDVVLNP